MSSALRWEINREPAPSEAPYRPSEVAIHNLNSLREAAETLLKEVESLANQQTDTHEKLGLQEELQRYETALIRDALQRTRGNQRRAAKLLGVKVTTLNCKIKRLGIQPLAD